MAGGRWPLAIVLSLALAGCITPPVAPDALAPARAAGMQHAEFLHGGFAMTMLWRVRAPGQPLRIYIEGDGRAWLDPVTPSPDPTPRQPVALQLALADDAPNVAYLARPCQYSLARSPACEPAHWTSQRFAPALIDAMEAAVAHVLALAPSCAAELVAYSGGAAIAVGIAARRADVLKLVTVAGNLDSEAVNRWHRADAMPASVNPISLAPRLAALPQLHFHGRDDRIIPPGLAHAFVAAGRMQSVAVIEVAGAAHGTGWQRHWPALLAAYLPPPAGPVTPPRPAHPQTSPVRPAAAASTP